MMPNITRGDRVAGVMVYLAGDGRHNEHTNPHVVAGHEVVVAAVGSRELSTDDALDIANELDQPRRVFGTRVTAPVKEWSESEQRMIKVGERDAHVWHCSLSLKSSEGQLSDEQWGRIAGEFVEGMGFTGSDDGGAGCRWVAVRHGLSSAGNDHVHVVVNLVREDGTKARVHNDMPRAQRLANVLEKRHGLVVLESRESGRGALAGAKPGELNRAERAAVSLPAREELRRRVRAAAAGAGGEREYLDALKDARVLVRPRYAEGGRERVVGYSVALVPNVVDGRREDPVWFGAGKLDRTLALGQLRSRWGVDVAGDAGLTAAWTERWRSATVAEKVAVSTPPADAARALHGMAGRLGEAEQRVAALDVAGVFARASLALEKDRPGPLQEASDALARAAQPPAHDSSHRERGKSERASLDAAYASRLVARATSRDAKVGWIAVLRQAERAARAIAHAQELRGQVQAAARTNQALAAVARAVPQLERAVQVGASGGQIPAHATRRPSDRGPARDRRDGAERD